jgi:N-terminal domain on NACHT_NTPase and P-loop NTPases
MAELAAIGFVASIVQLVAFGAKVLGRLNEFQSDLRDIPKSFRGIKVELPLLLDTLKGTQRASNAGMLGAATEKALLPVVNGCKAQIESLNTILDKILPKNGDSRARKITKALSSLTQERDIDKMSSTLRNHIQVLTYYHAAASSTLEPSKGT